MSSLRSPLLFALVLVWLTGCGAPPPPSATGALRLAVAAPVSEPDGPSRVTVSVPGRDSPALELVLTDGAWRGLLEHLPSHARHTLLAEGRAENVPVQADTTGLAVLMLRGLAQRPPVFNQAPLIDSLLMDTSLVAPGGSVSLTAQAHDPDPGDSVSYAWEAASGVFSAPGASSTTWTASSFQAPESLWFTVSDNRGAAFTVELSVDVSAGRGTRDVRVDFNTAPRVAGLTSSQSRLDVGQTTSLSVTATDLEGDALSYAWSATCAGTFSAPTSASTTFTPSARPTAACNNCQLSVQVKDGRGGQNTGGVALCVSKDAVAHAPPRFTLAYQSSPTARADQQLGFDVEASDPEGAALTFTWTANMGALGTASSDATKSHMLWTAAACAHSGLTPTVTATVTNAWGLSVTRSFTVTGLAACVPASWSPTGAMKSARRGHQAVRLLDGRVLVMGGDSGPGRELTSAELYDPVSGTWILTGALKAPRTAHTATLLPNGKVLVAAGYTETDKALATAEVYDPATGAWSAAGSLGTARFRHTATLLPNGKVLVTGGTTGSASLQTAESYDPATNTWSPTGSLSLARGSHRAELLADGRVLVAGGFGLMALAEVYNPATGTWSTTGALSSPRESPSLMLLPEGQVLIAGGLDNSTNQFLVTAERYNPATGVWSATGSMNEPRYGHTSTLLPNGRVLVTGGYSTSNSYMRWSEVYDPATGAWAWTGSMSSARNSHTATLLLDGRVLVAGGYNGDSSALATAEVYEPAP